MNLPKGFKQGVIPKGQENGNLIICTKCGFKSFYYGRATPNPKAKCPGCILVKRGFRSRISRVKRNPRIIHRNNPAPYRRK